MVTMKQLLGATCAASIMAGVAHAGALKIEIVDVNQGNDPAVDLMDDNVPDGPTGLNADFPTKVTSEDEIFYTLHRVTTADKPLQTHIEVDVFDIDPETKQPTGIATFSGDEQYFVEISLQGTADAIYKEDISPNQIVRPGSDGLFGESAEGFPNGQEIQRGSKTAQFFLTPNEDSETSIGFVLPVELRACGVLNIEIKFTTFVGDIQNTRTVNTADHGPAAECVGPSFQATAITNDVSVDIGTVSDPFELFLKPEGIQNKGLTEVNMIEFGVVPFDIHNHIFNAKEKFDLRERLTDVTDIETYTLQYEFPAGFDGIAGVVMVGCEEFAALDFDNNLATWVLNSQEVIDCFGLGGEPVDNGKQQGQVMLKIISNELEPIRTQKIALTQHVIDFVDRPNDINMFFPNYVLQAPIEDAWRIVRHGLNFGPFDWVAAPDKRVQSVFRVTGIPDTPASAPVPYTSGILLLENTQNSQDGFCSFDLAPWVNNGEAVVSMQKFADILNQQSGDMICYRASGEGQGPLTDFGRGDLTWSFYIPEAQGDKVDVDRLLWSPGDLFSDYGDNGNDAFSLKARSCDPGRFGGHTVNNLSGRQSDLLLFLCRTGELNFTTSIGDELELEL